MRNWKSFGLLACIIGAAIQVAAQEKTLVPAKREPSSAPNPDAEKIRAHVKFLASDLLEGRGTGQRGGDIAADYIATPFSLYGFKTAGDEGTYFQEVPMVGVKTLAETSFNFVPTSLEAMTLKNLEDFVTNNESQTEAAYIDAPIVFVGYGIKAPEYN